MELVNTKAGDAEAPPASIWILGLFEDVVIRRCLRSSERGRRYRRE